jgi:hypothetical protein
MAPPAPDDHLDELRERLRDTQAAAARLAEGIPRQGWASPEEGREAADEVEALAAMLRTLRDLVPPELAEDVREVLRQVLLLLRAVLDWWVERLELPEGATRAAAPVAGRGPDLEDIPVR